MAQARVAVAGIASVLAVGLTLVWTPSCAAGPTNPAAGPATDGHAADFELDRLQGGTLRLSDHLGKKVILLDFWATWCAPCRAAMPHLQELYREYRDDGLLVLGISVDGPESLAQIRAAVVRAGVSFPILLDRDTRVASLYSAKATAPYTVLIGRSGKLLSQREGYSEAAHQALVKELQSALGRAESPQH